jgi:hypothetical protein
MSVRAVAYVKQLVVCPNEDRLTKTEKLVALCLADSHQDKSATYTYPAVATLAEESLMDERSCRRILGELARKGVVEILRPVSQGRGLVNCYRFPALDPPWKSPGKGGHSVPLLSAQRGVERRAKGGQKPHPYIEELELEQVQNLKPPPVVPHAAHGGRAALKTLAPQVDAVMQGCGFAERRRSLRRLIEGQLQLECDKGKPAQTAALAMIAAWKRLRANAHLLRHDWGAAKFFGEGHWRDGSLPFDEQKLQRLRSEANARIGLTR